MKLVSFVILTLVFNGLTSCNQKEIGVTTKRDKQISKNVEITSKVSKFNSKYMSLFNITSVGIKNTDDISSLMFLDDGLKGWIGSRNGNIYQSIDGGVNWSKINVKGLRNFEVQDIFFNNSKIGWVIGSKTDAFVLDNKKNEINSILLKTEDGGVTWKNQFESKIVKLKEVSFIDNKSGWAIGTTFGDTLAEATSLILHSKDGGETWIDSSKPLNKSFESIRGYSYDLPTDITLSKRKPNYFKLLTNIGKVFETKDSGVSWSLKVDVNHKDEYDNFSKLDLSNEGKLAIISGANSLEGVFSIFTIQKTEKKWINYYLADFEATDLKYISNNEMIACGSIELTDENDSMSHQQFGAVIYSPDRGLSWSLIYKTTESDKFSSLHKLVGTDIIVAGRKGAVVKLHKN